MLYTYVFTFYEYIYLSICFLFRFKPTEVAEKITCKLSEEVTVSNNSNF